LGARLAACYLGAFRFDWLIGIFATVAWCRNSTA